MYPHLHLEPQYRKLVDWLLGRSEGVPPWDHGQWEKALELFRREQVEGLAYRRLKDSGDPPKSVPLPIRKRLEFAYQRTAARHLVATQALHQIDAACAERGIRLMVLRGIQLTDTLYRDPGCRAFLDIDLVAPVEEQPAARTLLMELGFKKSGSPGQGLTRGPIEVDLHPDPANIYLFPAYGKVLDYDPESFWRESRPYAPFHNLVRPGEADELIFLILHLVKHSFEGLMWWIDIYRYLIRIGEAGLPAFSGRTQACRTSHLIDGFLDYLGRLFPELPGLAQDRPSHFPLGLLFGLMLRGWRPPRVGMMMFFLSIDDYRWRLRLLTDKARARLRPLSSENDPVSTSGRMDRPS